MTVRLAFLLIAPLLALTACDDAPAPAEDDAQRAATGEVLEGSISDEMLAIEGLNSQPPVAAPLPGEGASGPAEPGEPAAANAEAPASDAPAPAATAEAAAAEPEEQ